MTRSRVAALRNAAAALRPHPGRVARWACALVLGGALGFALDADVQKRFLLPRLAPYVTSIDAEFLRITPWSLHVRGLALEWRGLRARVAEAELGVNPLALLGETLAVRGLHVGGATLDLSRFEPGESSATPFPGLLRTLEQGYALALEDVDVGVDVHLAEGFDVTLHLRGGDVRPHVSGGLDYALDVRAGTSALDTRGRLTLDQLSRGRFRAVAARSSVSLRGPGLQRPERLSTLLEIAPAPGAGALRYRAREAHGAGPLPPEAIRLEIRSLDARDGARASFDFRGLYHGVDGSVHGRYALDAVESLLSPYLDTLPAIAFDAQGLLGLQTMGGALDLTLDATTRLSHLERVLGDNPALPPRLELHSAATLALKDDRLAVTRFSHRLVGPEAAGDRAPLLEFALASPLVMDPAEPTAVFGAGLPLARFAVAGLPLAWANGLLGERLALDGRWDAAFEIAGDDAARPVLRPLAPARLSALSLARQGTVLAAGLELVAEPDARLADAGLRLRLRELSLGDGARRLAGGKLGLEIPSASPADAGAAARPLGLSFEVDGDVDALAALPLLAAQRADWPLPDALRFDARGKLALLGERITVSSLDARLARPAQPELLRLTTRQPFVLPVAGAAFGNPRGELAALRLRGIDFAWISPFLDRVDLEGRLASADLLLTAPDATRLAVAATAPLRVAGLGVGADGARLLRELDAILLPAVEYAPGRLSLALAGLRVARRNDTLVSGDLALDLPLAAEGGALRGEGRLDVDLRGLAAQPAARRALGRRPPDLALDAELDFAASHEAGRTTLRRFSARLAAGRRARLTLEASPGLEVRTTLAPGEHYARHVVGAVLLGVRDLSSAVIERFFPLEGVDFKEVDADLRLTSDGSRLRADSAAPLRLERVRVADGGRALLEPFEFRAEASVEVEARRLDFGLEDLVLNFDGAAAPALAGRLAAVVAPDLPVPLVRLSTGLVADLPQWLSQPLSMPGHGLRSGTLRADVDVHPDGSIAARALLDGLAADGPLALSRIELPVTGRMAGDGRGFSFSAPLVAAGRSGASDAAIEARYAPAPGKRGLLELDVDSRTFYLNDLLATIAAIGAPPSPASPGDPAAVAPAPAAIDRTPDQAAAWDILPYGTNLDYAIDTLHYTDYLVFNDVGGRLTVRSRKLALTDVAARFHDSPLKLDASLLFRPGLAEPYVLDLVGTVRDFDLNKFSRELLPGEKPRIKGRFSVKVAASGEMPNLGQLHNETLFDVRMNSRKGVFRPLPPSSVLLAGTSEMLGVVGEGLSYVPTGGFGAGALARIVNYISRFDYDLVDIHLRRPETRDVEIRRFLVQSPTISITARGGVTHVPGTDLRDSPLDLRANLDMAGRGAAILYSMGLLREERNEAGYWRGPEFRIWGTPSAAESNLDEILQQASEGSVKGGVTRPLAGLIGNIRYRWFGDEPAAARLDEDESADVKPTVRRREED